MKATAAPGVGSLAMALRSGDLALPDYLTELEAHFNRREPSLRAFLPEDGRFERLRREAEALLAQYPEPDARPPLFGVPVGVKDIFQAAGFTTRGGSQLPPEVLRGVEAESVARLKQAGVLILGKTVTTEFAYFAPGPTCNPHNPAHTPGGSSSGSAAAVAGGLCALSLGTQTIGSVTRPASFCGVVGFKPSYDRISRQGVIPLSPSLDHVGVFAADVSGADLAAGLLCREWYFVLAERKPVLAIPEGPYLEKASAEMMEAFRFTCDKLAAAGYTVKSVAAMPDFQAIYDRHYLIVAAEAAQVHADWFARYEERYHERTADLIRRGQRVSQTELDGARAGREALRHELTMAMNQEGIDLWLSPAAPGAAPEGLDRTGDPVMNLPWTHSGLPTLNLPMARNAAGLPLGLQVAGRWYADEALLEWALELETVISYQ